MLSDISKSISAYMYDRSASPLLGGFVVSWVVWNYEFFIVLLSDEAASSKIKMIDDLVFASCWDVWLQGLVFPLSTAAAYIFLYPYPALLVYEFSRRRKKMMVDKRNEIDEATLLTKEQSWEIRRMALLQQEEFDRTLSSKEAEIRELRSDRDRLLAEVTKANEENQPTLDEFFSESDGSSQAHQNASIEKLQSSTEEVLALMINIAQYNEAKTAQEVANTSGLSALRVQYELDRLTELKMVKRSAPVGGDAIYYITKEGRAYLIEKKVVSAD